MYYFPILKHEEMEYHNTDHGEFIEAIFKRNYKNWLKIFFKTINEKSFDLNDIDGCRIWRQHNTKMTPRMYLTESEHFAGYKTKRYPDTIEYNIEILKQYIQLCRNHNVEPIGFLLPFSELSKRHYPENSIKETLYIIDFFKEDMYFINLWNKRFPDSYFRDASHLKMIGGIECTKIIRECVLKIFNE